MGKSEITTTNAPQAIGPYSQAIQMGNILYCSGQIPVDPISGKVVSSDISHQTDQVLNNLKGVLAEVGLNLSHIVKTTIYLKNLDDFSKMNEAYAKFFERPFPARATIEVARLPLDVKIEIEAIANV